MSKLCEVFSHLCVFFSIMLLTFLILDQFNPMMNFVNNDISRWLLAGLCASAMGQSILRWKLEKKETSQ